MKNLTILIVLLLPLIFSSCKKKETHHASESVSKGEFLILVVSDSVECAMEYKEDQFPSSSLKKSPAYTLAEFGNGYYNISIYMPGVGLYGSFAQDILDGYRVVDFPKFSEYYSDTFIDSIPGNQLKKNEVYATVLDTSKIDFIRYPYYEDEVNLAWNKIKNLRIVFEYRRKFPESQIAFLHVEKQNGEAKSYFFMNKYKP